MLDPVLDAIRNNILIPNAGGSTYLGTLIANPQAQIRVWDASAPLNPDGSPINMNYVLLKTNRDRSDQSGPIPNVLKGYQFFVTVATTTGFVDCGAYFYDGSPTTIMTYGGPQGINTLLDRQTYGFSNVTLAKIGLIGGGQQIRDDNNKIFYQSWLYEVAVAILLQEQLIH